MKKHDYTVHDDKYIYGTFKATSEQSAKDMCCVQIGYLDESDMLMKENFSRLEAVKWPEKEKK